MNEISKPGATPAQAVSTQPSKASFRRLSECENLKQAFETREIAERINDALPRHMDGAAMLRACIQAASKTPLIYECDLRQSLGAFLSISYLGLVPGTALQHVHLIPFRSKKWSRETRRMEDCVDLNVIIGYPGYVELMHRSGVVKSVHADIVLPGEHFRVEHGSHKILEHRPELDHDTEGLVPRCAYSFVNMAGDDDQFEVMPWHDVLKIRNRSQAFRTALAAKEEAEANGKRLPKTWTEAPWVKDEREMAKKTPFRRLAKWLPKCAELRAATALEDLQDRGRVNYGAVIDGSASPLDGLPELEDDGPPPVDPGTAHGMRGSIASDPAPAKTAAPAAAAAKPATAKAAKAARAADEPPDDDRFGPAAGAAPPAQAAPAKASPAAQPTHAPVQEEGGFETMLIGADGMIANDEPFTDPVAFARAFMALWNVSGADGEALCEHNADALDEASDYPIAAEILAPLDDDTDVVNGDSTDAATTVPPAVEVPIERGKPSWPGYVAALKRAMSALNAAQFPGWAFVQRETLERCPVAQRVLAIRAMSDTAALLRASSPPWLADLIKPKPAASAAPANDPAPAAAASVTLTVDERWAEARIAELAAITQRAELDALSTSAAVRTVMARLRRENKPLFDRLDIAFTDKHHELPHAQEGA